MTTTACLVDFFLLVWKCCMYGMYIHVHDFQTILHWDLGIGCWLSDQLDSHKSSESAVDALFSVVFLLYLSGMNAVACRQNCTVGPETVLTCI